MLITNKEELSWWNLNTTFNIGQTKKGHSRRAVSHGTPGSCRSCRTVRVEATRADKHAISKGAIIKVRRQLGTPRTEVLVEAWCTIEHVPHVCHRAYVPPWNVRIEGLCIIEHVPHICHSANVPVRNVRIETWRTFKHALHVRHRANIPVWNVRIEACCKFKHVIHVRDRANVPIWNVRIESLCIIEHAHHACRHGANIPVRNVGIESWFTIEQKRHVRDKLHTPVSNLSILSTSGTGGSSCTILTDVVVDSSL